jgi:hypothetical protein
MLLVGGRSLQPSSERVYPRDDDDDDENANRCLLLEGDDDERVFIRLRWLGDIR